MTVTRAQLTAAIELARVACEAVRTAPSGTLPSGHLYALLMPSGISLETYQSMLGLLVRSGVVRLEGDLVRWVQA